MKPMASVEKMHKVNVIAPLRTEAAALAEVAEALSLPEEKDRQPDLQYLSAIFVSTGMNKNGAVFLGSELVKARKTISNKAVDLEHDEKTVVGQITGNVFLNRDRTIVDVENTASSMSVKKQDELEMDIGITAIIHKARFPDIAAEIADGVWMVSMEAYYSDFDIKVGDTIIPREKAEEMGVDRLVGSVVQLKDGDKEMGFHLVGRVLRDILFAGVGLVRNPANPRSIIMEAAAINEYADEEAKKGESSGVIINLADIEKLEVKEESEDEKDALPEGLQTFVINTVKAAIDDALQSKDKEEAMLSRNHITPGTCVNYKRYVYAAPKDDLPEPPTDTSQYPLYHNPGPVGTEDQTAVVVGEHYCNLFDKECSARPGDATSPTCWRNVFARTVREEIFDYEQVLRLKRIQEGYMELQNLLDKLK
jgi:hypothetical protein